VTGRRVEAIERVADAPSAAADSMQRPWSTASRATRPSWHAPDARRRQLGAARALHPVRLARARRRRCRAWAGTGPVALGNSLARALLVAEQIEEQAAVGFGMLLTATAR
jgi:hypothetical protein